VRCKLTDISEEYITSIFRFEEYDKQETGMKQVANSASFLLGLVFYTEEGGDMFLRNID
jgi:hypothetical protein